MIFVREIFTNFINKIPKILIIIVIMFVLVLNSKLFFGTPINKVQTTSANDSTMVDISKVREHFGEGVEIEQLTKIPDGVAYSVVNKSEIVGYILSSSSLAENCVRGYAGPTPVMVFASKDFVIEKVQLLENSETRGFIMRLERAGFFDRFIGHKIGESTVEVEAISGATYSSNAIIDNVNALLQRVNPEVLAKPSIFKHFSVGSVSVLLVVILSLVCYAAPKRTRRLRLPVLVASVAVLGVWQGAFISIELLYNWLINGVDLWERLVMVLIVAAGLLIPLFTNKNYYCTYLCPFGAAQELAGKLCKRKVPIPQRVVKVFSRVKPYLLLVIVLALLFLPGFQAESVEPFTLFMIKSASVSAIVIGVLSILASFVINRPWCRLLCPTGSLIGFFQKEIKYGKLFAKRS